MADEQIAFDISASGVQQTAGQFEMFSKALTQTSQNSAELSAESRVLGATLTETGGSVGFLSKSYAAANENAQIFKEHGRQMKTLVGELGRSFQVLNPEIAIYSEVLRTGIGVMHGFMELLGGPATVAIGAAVVAFTTLGIVWSHDEKEAQKLAKATKKVNDELDKHSSLAWQKQNIAKRDTNTNDWDALSNAAASDSEYEAVLSTMNAKREKALGLAAKNNDREQAVFADDLRVKIEYFTKQREIARGLANEEDVDDSEGPYKKRKATKAAGSGDDFAREQKNEDAIRKLDKAMLDSGKDIRAMELTDKQRHEANLTEMDKLRFEDKKKLATLDQQFENENAHVQDAIDAKQKLSWQQQTAEFQKQQQLKHASTVLLQQDLMKLGETGAQTFTKGLSELAKGHKLAIGQIIESLGDQLVATGTITLFQGLGRALSSYGLDPTSEAMIALGGVEVGAGLAMGAAGAKAAGGSNAGKGGGSAGAGGSQQAASPNAGGGSQNAPAQPMIINITTPSVISPSAEEGLMIQKAVQRAVNVYGPVHIRGLNGWSG
jgi:hypothetical protein